MNPMSLANKAPVENVKEREQRLLAMGQMAATLAHEIRNPLGSLDLFCSLLMTDLKGQPESLKLATQMHNSIKRLDQIVSNCLQFTRDVTPQRVIVPDVGSWVRELVDSLRPQADAAAVKLETQAAAGSAYLDPFLLTQVLTNLILNAIQACDSSLCANRGELPLCVRLEVSPVTEDSIQFRVVDNGCGIPVEVQERIFDPFFSTKTSGTGLGLAVVHSLVTAQGGWLHLESTPGAGSVFSLTLPATLHRSEQAKQAFPGEKRDERKGECINC